MNCVRVSAYSGSSQPVCGSAKAKWGVCQGSAQCRRGLPLLLHGLHRSCPAVRTQKGKGFSGLCNGDTCWLDAARSCILLLNAVRTSALHPLEVVGFPSEKTLVIEA